MRKILASDYDGTLNQNGISERDVEAIRKWRAEGNLFGIVTGRDFIWSYGIFKKENRFPFDFIISHSGAACCDTEGNILFSNKMSKKGLAMAMTKEAIRLSGNPSGVAFEKTRLDFLPENYKGKNKDNRKYSDLAVLDEVIEFNMVNIHCDTVEIATETTRVMREKFGEFANPNHNGKDIDISPAGVDKRTSIAQYAKLMGVALENVWTAGDNLNDLPMLCGYHGCAMSSGVQAAKDAAEYICDCVADVIEIALR